MDGLNNQFSKFVSAINLHKFLFIRNKLKIGTIDNPYYDELIVFYFKCEDVNIQNYYRVTFKPIYLLSTAYYFTWNPNGFLSKVESNMIHKTKWKYLHFV